MMDISQAEVEIFVFLFFGVCLNLRGSVQYEFLWLNEPLFKKKKKKFSRYYDLLRVFILHSDRKYAPKYSSFI